MEAHMVLVGSLSSSFFVALFLFVFFIATLKRMRKSSEAGQKLVRLPPGPPRLPLVGNIHHLAGANPHRKLRHLARAHGPLLLLRLGQADLVVASSVEAVEEIVKVHDLNFADRPSDLTFANILSYDGLSVAMAPYGGYWKQMRKVYAMELLNSRRVKSFAAIRERAVRKLSVEIANASRSQSTAPLNLSQMVMSMTNELVIRAAFGERCEQKGKFLKLVKEGVGLVTSFAVADMFPSLKFLDTLTGLKFKLQSVRRQIDEVFDEIISQRQVDRASGSSEEEDRIIDVLLRLKDQADDDQEFPITSTSIKAIVLEIFLGGTETSSTVIEWAMSELMKNPEVMEKAQREIRESMQGQGKTELEESDIAKFDYLKLVIKETLRLHPPGPLLLPRVCRETCEVLGYRVPAGARVLINAWALGRDERYWGADAESFRPERFASGAVDFRGFNFEFVPFGAGRRICPGMTFGLSSVEVGLAHLLFYFDWKLPGGMNAKELDMTEISGASAPRKSPLFLLANPRVPLP
ncbi:alpha-humulene 10-hydroxylase-like [Zingiber officinale]|nr:alpha-humulene 10-hydroxylase-like [Zingiber officinale]